MRETKKIQQSSSGFTLLELLTVIVVISIMAVMILPAIGFYRGRSERLACSSNLKSLYVAASNFTTDNQAWPQIPLTKSGSQEQARAWHAALERYGISWNNWVCPSIQRAAGHPDMTRPEKQRIDYFATPFDNKPRTPWRWLTQPWFIERGDMHGNGNLVIFPDGTIEDLRSVGRRASMVGSGN
jgi:prepilin-type N-terminal cleavage/methylation domain-containing protein